MADIVNAFLKWPLPVSVCVDRCAMMPGEKNRSGTNLLTCPETVGMVQEVVRPIVERLMAEDGGMATINERDRAEDAADKLASAVLGEPIDWSDHEAKWAEALELAEAKATTIKNCAESLNRYAAECFPEIVNGQKHFVRALMESWAESLTKPIENPDEGSDESVSVPVQL